VLHVPREIDRGHPAAPELPLHTVAVGKGGLQTREKLGQSDAGQRVPVR
jgi:hypothetical protein